MGKANTQTTKSQNSKFKKKIPFYLTLAYHQRKVADKEYDFRMRRQGANNPRDPLQEAADLEQKTA